MGTDPSADPGAKTEGAAQRAALSFPPFGIGIKALNPRGSGGGSPRAFAPLRLARSYHHGPHYRLVVTVSITGSLAAVLVVRGCTPKHPFVNTSAYGRRSGHIDRAQSIPLRPPRGRGSSQSLARSVSRWSTESICKNRLTSQRGGKMGHTALGLCHRHPSDATTRTCYRFPLITFLPPLSARLRPRRPAPPWPAASLAGAGHPAHNFAPCARAAK